MPDEHQLHFIEQIIEDDIAGGKWGPAGDSSVVTTRFPPEPNGYLHIGHTKAICLSFGLAQKYGGRCNLRFDDTNPAKEEREYIDAIQDDIRWLGFDWGDKPLHASDYFEWMYGLAIELIEKGKAFVCELSGEQVRETRGSPSEAGKASPFRDRPAEESVDLFGRMRSGEFADGSRTLRAKIDMNHPNLTMRDPVMYRILRQAHPHVGDSWCVYPMYDWAHGLEDSREGVTHSLCTLEFENHRPLYDWFIDAINEGRGEKIHHSQQTEFAKLLLGYTLMSKRNLVAMVKEGHVSGWDDPRMATIRGMRRRGWTPESIRAFCDDIGITKYNSLIDFGRLENAVRGHLNRVAPRRMGVLRPLRVLIENYPEGQVEMMSAVNNPEDDSAGRREVPFTRELFIERADFMEDAPKKFFRLRPGGEVRLRYAYWITCTGVEKDENGEVSLLRCTYDPQTKGGEAPPPDAEGKQRKVKGTLHWVSAEHAQDAEVRVFDRLFKAEQPGKETGDFRDDLNPDSIEVVSAKIEPGLGQEVAPDEPEWADGIRRFQLERHGYFCVDRDSTPDKLVLNRTVGLRDSWSKAKK